MSLSSSLLDLGALLERSRLTAPPSLSASARTELDLSFERARRTLEEYGDSPRFQRALATLLERGTEQEGIREALMQLGPWRKGPHVVRQVAIDAEWDCRLKWARVEALGIDLEGRSLLDVGAGNGYYLRRMVENGAAWALGIEPSVRYFFQFLATELENPSERLALLSERVENLSPNFPLFDVVFSMGVLYHVRSPIDHLVWLRNRLKRSGELLLETLIVPGTDNNVLVPRHRYANMRNVWFIPSEPLLGIWLERAGFELMSSGEPVRTTPEEQRATAFAPGPSLLDALHPTRPTETVEGYPAPTRLLVRARPRL
jgi:tRNA (mo5U34)-methyltransferase